MAYLADLASTNPLVSTLVAGTSVEGRQIVQATISSDRSANKPIAWFDCIIHAREWITAATCVWIIDTVGLYNSYCHMQYVCIYQWIIVLRIRRSPVDMLELTPRSLRSLINTTGSLCLLLIRTATPTAGAM
jgi:hypothetical protein